MTGISSRTMSLAPRFQRGASSPTSQSPPNTFPKRTFAIASIKSAPAITCQTPPERAHWPGHGRSDRRSLVRPVHRLVAQAAQHARQSVRVVVGISARGTPPVAHPLVLADRHLKFIPVL